MPSRKTTNGHSTDGTLTPQQQAAVDILASGRTMQDTADQVQVARETVSGWVNHSPPFQAALNLRRQELWGEMAHRLRGLLPRALDVVEKELSGDAPLQAALHILKAVNLYGGVGPPAGATSIEEIEQIARAKEIEKARTALTEQDVRLAEAQREADRRGQALCALAFT